MKITRHIPRDEIKTLPLFAGLSLSQITLVQDEAMLAAAAERLAGEPVLGFDTESRPTFHKGQKPTGPHLVQLATADHAWLFPLGEGAMPPALAALLARPGLTLAGFDLSSDRAHLKNRFGVTDLRLLDIGNLFQCEDKRLTIGAVQAVAQLFGQYFRKSKKVSTSNWSLRTLSEAQQLYAANDAWVAFRVWQALQPAG
ncbi:3'-5' exonuclease [Vogesella oryzae]|uniref:3'-5' exonuclease n=1 Tax=Vogesella oryzae TaxID=1735285 RepID=UPI00158235A0|nr:3'-5' exonuclease [Vogesella oryzae]